MPEIITEFPVIYVPVRVSELSNAHPPSFNKLSSIYVPIVESLSAMPFFQTVLELALVTISDLINVNSKPVGLSVEPLPYIRLSGSLGGLPHATPVLLSFVPLAIVNLSIVPDESPFSFFVSLHIFPIVIGRVDI